MNVLRRTRKKPKDEIIKPEKIVPENKMDEMEEVETRSEEQKPEESPFAPEPYVKTHPKSGSYSIRGKAKGAIN